MWSLFSIEGCREAFCHDRALDMRNIYFGIMENNMETTIMGYTGFYCSYGLYSAYIGIMEKKMESTTWVRVDTGIQELWNLYKGQWIPIKLETVV